MRVARRITEARRSPEQMLPVDGGVVVRAALLPHVGADFAQYVGENDSGPGHPSVR